MEHAQTRLRQRHLLFIKCGAVIAVIFLITLISAAQSTATIPPEVPWPEYLQKYPGLMAEFGQLLDKLSHGVQFPSPRSQGRLLPLQQESTVFYAAFPNYGEASHQALKIFQKELQVSPVLRAWWQHGELATAGPKVEDALEKIYQLSQFLGDELTVSAGTEGRQGPSLMVLAEIRKPGLEDFLQQMANHLADKSKPPFHVFDVQELAAAKDILPPQQPMILVRPDLVVGTLDLGELRRINVHLDGTARKFPASPFGQRIAQAYEGGTTVVGAIDLQKILQQVPHGTDQNQIAFQRTGFADMKYLVWEHKSVDGQATSQMELSFTSPRHGVASWLAAPGPLRSLDFVSPKAVLAATVLLSNPAQIFDDVKDISSALNPIPLAAIAQMEEVLKLSLKKDVLSRLGREITIELDSLAQPDPVWKVILQVNDPDRLQATVNALLAGVKLSARRSEEEGVKYDTLLVPSAKKALEIGYAFVDGYLVIASSPDTLSETLRIHRTGESLSKSKRFLASLPPGHLSEVSALLYEDPLAMSALTMRQVSPEMAESLLKARADSTPVVICAYAEESALREVSRSRGVDAGAILVAAAVAIPNLLRARIAANEASAVGMIRTASVAQISYSVTYPQKGFARDLATLGPDPGGTGKPSAEHAAFIDSTLGNAACTAGAWCTKSGFQFSMTAVCKKQGCDEYVVVGTPENSGTGSRSFCSTSDLVVRFKIGLPLTAPVSASECRAWPPLQ